MSRDVDAETRLVDFLRRTASLTGTKWMCRFAESPWQVKFQRDSLVFLNSQRRWLRSMCRHAYDDRLDWKQTFAGDQFGKLRNRSLRALTDFRNFQCLMPLMSCNGAEITTVEGIGNKKDGYHPVQVRLTFERCFTRHALTLSKTITHLFYSSVCRVSWRIWTGVSAGIVHLEWWCPCIGTWPCESVIRGFLFILRALRPPSWEVFLMTSIFVSLLQEKGPKNISMRDIEMSFGGNICRCTGYRPIMDAFKTFANDATPELRKHCVDLEATLID